MLELSWRLLTLGRLTRNKFWGETERVRETLCTNTLIRTAEGLLLVDPPLPPEQMPALLLNQAGVTIADVRHVFLTHFHADHRFGLAAFEHATRWLAPAEITYWRERGNDAERALLEAFRPAAPEVLPGIATLAAPGHTPGLAALAFRWRGRRVIVAGDAVMTEEYFWAREGFHNSSDFAQAGATVERLAGLADIVVPGHGNYFLTAASPGEGGMWGGGRTGAVWK